eukprot:5288246-Alexandrium_andersonii.AAC.1
MTPPTSLRIATCNVGTLSARVADVLAFMHTHDLQVLAAQETRLSAIQKPAVLGFCRSKGCE